MSSSTDRASPDPAPRRRRAVPDDTIRRRCPTPQAATYTLFVRSLVDRSAGGQAALLRTAAEIGVSVPGVDRRALSAQLSGGHGYPRGPSWPVVEMIIDCLPDRLPGGLPQRKGRLRAKVAGLYHLARNELPPGYTDDMAYPADDPTDETEAEKQARKFRQYTVDELTEIVSDLRYQREKARVDTVHRVQRLNAMLQDQRLVQLAQEAQIAEMENQLANERERRIKQTLVARQVPRLREECARLAAENEMLRAPSLRQEPIIVLPVPAGDLTIQLGRLAAHIDAYAPAAARGLARYLCTHAELLGLTVQELALRARLRSETVEQLLAARRVATLEDVAPLARLLDIDANTMQQYLAIAGSATDSLDGVFTEIVASYDDNATTTSSSPGPGPPVNSYPQPDNDPTSVAASAVGDQAACDEHPIDHA